MVKRKKSIKGGVGKLSAKDKILQHLIENKDPQSIRTISGAVVLDYKNTYGIVDELKGDVISKDKIGNTSLVKLNLKPNQDIFSVENKRTMQFIRDNKKLGLVKQDIESLNYPFMIVLIFGSYVKKSNTKRSDIDICIISDNDKITKRLMSKLGLLPFKLEIHDFTTEEFEEMLKTKEENIGKEIVKKNIILYGVENYYNLISKWMKKE